MKILRHNKKIRKCLLYMKIFFLFFVKLIRILMLKMKKSAIFTISKTETFLLMIKSFLFKEKTLLNNNKISSFPINVILIPYGSEEERGKGFYKLYSYITSIKYNSFSEFKDYFTKCWPEIILKFQSAAPKGSAFGYIEKAGYGFFTRDFNYDQILRYAELEKFINEKLEKHIE